MLPPCLFVFRSLARATARWLKTPAGLSQRSFRRVLGWVSRSIPSRYLPGSGYVT
jgi:hypothetical protein